MTSSAERDLRTISIIALGLWILLCVWAGLPTANGLDSVEIRKATKGFSQTKPFEPHDNFDKEAH
jgi:hypothetical protein